MLDVPLKYNVLWSKASFYKDLILTSVLVIVCSLTVFSQEYTEEEESLRDDQYSIGFMPSLTFSSKLNSKFSYSLASSFKFQKKGGELGFWLGATIDHSFFKSSERYLSYNPKSDTSYIIHWNIALYAFHFGWDGVLVNNIDSKLYFRVGLNAGSYIHRSRIVRHYLKSQDDKIIDEVYTNIGQPNSQLNLGITLGFGYEYYLKMKQSISFTPTLYMRSGGYNGLGFITLGVNAAYNFGLSKNVKR